LTTEQLIHPIIHTLEEATYPRRVARTGVLQGDAANANVRPARYACTPANYSQIKILFATKASLMICTSVFSIGKKQCQEASLDGRLAAAVRGSKSLKNEGSCNSSTC
jgi:hypothetical protein